MSEEIEIELETLEAIYGDMYEKLEDAESLAKFRITLTSTPSDEIELQTLEDYAIVLILTFTLTNEYPNVLPLIHLRVLKGLKVAECESIKQSMNKAANEVLGEPMVYAMTSIAKELIDSCVAGEDLPVFSSIIENSNSNTSTQKKDYSLTKMDGTPVTPESFAKWETSFQEELNKNPNVPWNATFAKKLDKTKLSGRDQFLLKSAESILELEVSDDEEDEEESEEMENQETTENQETIILDKSIFADESINEDEFDFSSEEAEEEEEEEENDEKDQR